MRRLPIVAISTGVAAIVALVIFGPVLVDDDQSVGYSIERIVAALGLTGVGFLIGLLADIPDEPPAEPPSALPPSAP